MAVVHALSWIGKTGFVLKSEQIQAVHHILYQGRDVHVPVRLSTRFGKSICYEVLPCFFESECSIVVVVSRLVSLMVGQVTSLPLHGVHAKNVIFLV